VARTPLRQKAACSPRRAPWTAPTAATARSRPPARRIHCRRRPAAASAARPPLAAAAPAAGARTAAAQARARAPRPPATGTRVGLRSSRCQSPPRPLRLRLGPPPGYTQGARGPQPARHLLLCSHRGPCRQLHRRCSRLQATGPGGPPPRQRRTARRRSWPQRGLLAPAVAQGQRQMAAAAQCALAQGA
jgi:hypothetical protein